jgi:hypothetical protein
MNDTGRTSEASEPITKLFDWRVYNEAADEFRGIKKRKASSQSGSSEQREAQALGGGGDEPGDVVSKEEGRGEIICAELPYVEARQFEEGPFVVFWWRRTRYAFEMDLVEAKYIHLLMGYAIDAIEQQKSAEQSEGKGEV